MPRTKDIASEIAEHTQLSALLGLKRLEALLQDPEASNADVVKGLSLLFEHVCPPAAASGEAGGDMEVHLSP